MPSTEKTMESSVEQKGLAGKIRDLIDNKEDYFVVPLEDIISP